MRILALASLGKEFGQSIGGEWGTSGGKLGSLGFLRSYIYIPNPLAGGGGELLCNLCHAECLGTGEGVDFSLVSGASQDGGSDLGDVADVDRRDLRFPMGRKNAPLATIGGTWRKYACMNSPARRCVNAIPEAASFRSIPPCIRAKRKGESSSGMIPESLTTCLTPALRAASMKFDCTSSIMGSEDEMSMARSTPRSAPVSVSGRAMSPSTISTCGSEENPAALAALRTSARTGTPFADSRRTNSLPFSPVAPVTSIIFCLLSS